MIQASPISISFAGERRPLGEERARPPERGDSIPSPHAPQRGVAAAQARVFRPETSCIPGVDAFWRKV
jgi:hypothetical protein